MPDECSKAVPRRLRDPRFADTYFVGRALDVGAGGDGLSKQREHWPGLTEVRDWDIPDGDAQTLDTVPDGVFDVCHSSHCLEHMRDPLEALLHWLRVVRAGGYVVVLVPDEDMYEQGVFPFTFNSDHKWTFTSCKATSWSLRSVSVTVLLAKLASVAELMKLEVVTEGYDWTLPRQDQTGGAAACAIEFVLRKRHPWEIARGGRIGVERR